MPIELRRIALAVVFCVPLAALSQPSPFVGTWHIRKSSSTGKPNITINIVPFDHSLGGTVIVVNPDRTEMTETIAHPSVTGTTLRFETLVGDEPAYWILTLDKGQQSGILEGNIREMFLKERVTRQR